jgi:phage-related minor tail protein
MTQRSSGKQFGFSEIETAAFASAMVAAGAESEVAATTFRNMGKALTRGASATGRQREAFRTLGLDARKVAEAMQRDAVGTTVRVIEKLNQIPEAIRASVLSDLFGDEARAIGPLVTNLDLLKGAIRLVADEQVFAGSAAREYAVRAATSANRTQLFWNRVRDLSIALGNALIPGLLTLLDLLEPIIDTVTDLAERFPTLTAVVAGAAAGLVAFRIVATAIGFVALNLKGAVLGLVAGFGKLRAVVLVVARLFLANPIIAAAVGIATAAYLIYENWDRIVAFFERIWEGIKAAFTAGVAVVTAVLDKLGLLEPLKAAWEGLKTFFAGLWEGIALIFENAWAAISPVVDLIRGAVEFIGGIGSDEPSPPSPGIQARASFLRGVSERARAEGREQVRIFGRGAVGRAAAAPGGSMTVAPQFTFNIEGKADAAEIESHVRRALRDETRELVRGVYADTGPGL